MIVSIDGPSGSGKSTVSRAVANRLGYALLDTGALYRGAALLALQANVDPADGRSVATLIEKTRFQFRLIDEESRLFLDGIDVSSKIRTPQISEGASVTSAQPEVRDALLETQRIVGRNNDCVVEGRDIGTVVFPDAGCKFFLTASIEERTRRRREQYLKVGRTVSDDELRREVEDRDNRDAGRQVSPLKPADDAVLVDSTGLSFDEVVELIVKHVEIATRQSSVALVKLKS